MPSSSLSLINENEYLHTVYRPDCDYVDGLVLERNVGTPSHSRLQTLILFWLMQHEEQWHIQALAECRLKIRTRKYRVPDIIVLPATAPRPQDAIDQPPLLCIEIVSPKDQLADLVVRAGDYLLLGTPVTWILDPRTKQAFVFSDQGTVESFDPVLRHGHMQLPVTDLFKRL